MAQGTRELVRHPILASTQTDADHYRVFEKPQSYDA